MPNRTTTEALKHESPGVNCTGGAPHRRTSALLALLWCGLMPLPVHPQTNATPAAAQTERTSVGVARLDSAFMRAHLPGSKPRRWWARWRKPSLGAA